MEFIENKAIYLQIAERICEKILTRQWQNNDRIPAVREIAVSFEVNPNTANRACDFLQKKGIIYNKRGLGFFVAEDGYNKALMYKREDFYAHQLPAFFNNMSLLNLKCEDLEKYYEEMIKNK